MWRIIGVTQPTESPNNRDKARLAFQKLWVAGTLGAFFIAVAKNLPIHMAQFSLDMDFAYTMEVFLKYIYLLWFLCYFFISNVRNEHEESTSNQDLIFDIIQSSLALMTAYAIGFIVPNVDIGNSAFLIANFSILAIALLSLHLYSEGAGEGVNKIRCIVAGVALLSIFTIALCHLEQADKIINHTILLVLSVILWLMLWPFFFIRLDREEWR